LLARIHVAEELDISDSRRELDAVLAALLSALLAALCAALLLPCWLSGVMLNCYFV
jgi:hypothetical protein